MHHSSTNPSATSAQTENYPFMLSSASLSKREASEIHHPSLISQRMHALLDWLAKHHICWHVTAEDTIICWKKMYQLKKENHARN